MTTQRLWGLVLNSRSTTDLQTSQSVSVYLCVCMFVCVCTHGCVHTCCYNLFAVYTDDHNRIVLNHIPGHNFQGDFINGCYVDVSRK